MGFKIILGTAALSIALPFAGCETVRADEDTEYVVQAVEIKPEEAPRIDGIWNDPVWKKGRAIAMPVQRDPLAGEPATEASEIFLLYDPENLYVGCRLYDAHPEHVINELRRRESVESSDTIELLFDTFHDHRTGYAFAMNPSGVQMDALRFNDDQENGSWDGIWKSAAGIDSVGWVAEFKIPFFIMRFPDTQEQVWGFNVQREIRYKAERVNWKPVSVNDRSLVRISTLGHLAGIRGIRPGRNIELYPYGLAGFSDTFDSPMHSQKDVGFDVKYGLASDVTLDVTVNPDFAQVEADVLEINLTRFPTQFPEKRKFFLEGRDIFETPVGLFYSRRIGSRGDILWGSKLTGKTKKGGLEYGMLASQTGEWNYFGLTQKQNNGNNERALFGVARLKKGFSNGSSIGIIATDKEIKGGPFSRIFGVDGNILYRGIYKAAFQMASSMNTGLLKNNNYRSLGLFRFAIPWTVRITAELAEPDFEMNGTGYMQKEPHRGWQEFRTVVSYNPLIEKMGIRQINIFSSWRAGQDLFTQRYADAWQQNNPETPIRKEYAEGRLRSGRWLFDQAYGIRTTNEMNLSWWYAVGKTNELNTTYRPWNHGINISTPRSGSIQKILVNFRASWGTFYNFSRKYLGKSWMVGGDETSWVRSNLGLELSCDYRKTFAPSGDADGNYFRLSMNNTLLLTKDLFLRLYTQGRWGTTYYGKKRIENVYLVSFLFGWEFNPGSWIYLAYNEGREDLNDLNDPAVMERAFFQTDRTMIAKVTYAFYR